MRISHRVRAMRTALTATTRRMFSRFSVEEFIRIAILKDLDLLRSKYHRQVPSYVTAADLAACIELHELTHALISEGAVLDGVYLLHGAVGYEVCLVAGGKRSDVSRYQHLHAASIDYVQRLLVEIDRLPAAGVGTTEVKILAPSKAPSPRLISPLREGSREPRRHVSSSPSKGAHLRIVN